MDLERIVELMNFADQVDVKVSIYIQGGRYFLGYMDTLTDDAQRAWRDLRAVEAQLCAA